MAAIVVLGWFYMAHLNAGMPAMSGMLGEHGMAKAPTSLGLAKLASTFDMWAIMMAAMMLPSTIPSVSLFMTMSAQRSRDVPGLMTALFVMGYVSIWVAYCIPAALAQWGLARVALLNPMGQSSSLALSAAILIGAGLFQFSRLKNACMTACRSPLAFLMAEWRDGPIGAFVVGTRQGGYCVLCCWALMAVMFVVGVMSLAWMGVLTLLILAEKVVPARWQFDRLVGVGLILWGVSLFGSVLA